MRNGYYGENEISQEDLHKEFSMSPFHVKINTEDFDDFIYRHMAVG